MIFVNECDKKKKKKKISIKQTLISIFLGSNNFSCLSGFPSHIFSCVMADNLVEFISKISELRWNVIDKHLSKHTGRDEENDDK